MSFKIICSGIWSFHVGCVLNGQRSSCLLSVQCTIRSSCEQAQISNYLSTGRSCGGGGGDWTFPKPSKGSALRKSLCEKKVAHKTITRTENIGEHWKDEQVLFIAIQRAPVLELWMPRSFKLVCRISNVWCWSDAVWIGDQWSAARAKSPKKFFPHMWPVEMIDLRFKTFIILSPKNR